jgi:hypothetical protein
LGQCVSGCSLGLGMGGSQSLLVWLVVVVVACAEAEGRASGHHWDTVVRIVGSVISGVFLSGELLISLLSSSVRVVGQMVNAMAQVGLVEKSGSGMCVCWNIGHICWCDVRSVVPRKRLGHRSQQRVHPMELRTVSGNSRKMLECSCCVCIWRDWKPSEGWG